MCMIMTYIRRKSIVELCNIVLPNFQYLYLIYYYIPLRVFDASGWNTMVIFPA
jgi:hypothetical protein